MKLLAVDTASRAASLALLDGDALVAFWGTDSGRDHAETLLDTLHRLLGEMGWSLTDLDGFAVAIGPGSFTGLRIGIATVEGLSYATGRPATGVSTLEATAYRYRHRSGCIAAFLDAQRKEIYGQLFDSDGVRLTMVGEPICEPPETFLDRVAPNRPNRDDRPVLIAGTGTVVYRKVIERFGSRLLIAEPSFFLAEAIARLGRERLLRGEAASLGGLEALYIRPSDAEKARQGGRARS